MDFEAGLPILVDSFLAVVLLSWLSGETRWMERCLRIYVRGQAPFVTEQLRRTSDRVRAIAVSATLVSPSVMAFSGQLDEHGIAHIYNNALQVVAPTTSACFSAIVAWLLIVSPLVVHRSHLRLLGLFPRSRRERDFW